MSTTYLVSVFSLLAFPFFAQPSQLRIEAANPQRILDTTAAPALTSAAVKQRYDAGSVGSGTANAAAEDNPDKYVTELRALLNQDRFDRLDLEASSVRSGKTRFSGGGWKLPRLYGAIVEPPGGSEALDADWEGLIAKLKMWRAQRPDSVTAPIALAETYSGYAWKARSIAPSYKVTEESWRLFQERLQFARSTLNDASALREKCPEWYAAMQTVALGQGWEREESTELFRKAIAFEPDYDFYYRNYAQYLLPKWYGEEGESERFAEEISNEIGGRQGDVIYFEIARELRCECLPNMSWRKIQRGYAALEELYGTSSLRENQFAYLAIHRKEATTAHELFLRIGDDWDKETWMTQKYFESSKTWASWMAERVAAAVSASGANMQTEEGTQYEAQALTLIKQKIPNALAVCAEQGIKEAGQFDVFVRFDAQGLAQTFLAQPQTGVSDCWRSQVVALMFPSPPEPDSRRGH